MGLKNHSIEEIGRAQKRVERLGKLLRIKLRQNMPYYGFIITKLSDFVFTEEIETAATDGLDIFINPEFMVEKSDAEINFILLHELLHVVFMHRVRFEKNKNSYDHKLWNAACDYIINYELCTQKNAFYSADVEIEIPADCLLMRDENTLRDLSNFDAEKLYNELYNDNNSQNPRDFTGDEVPMSSDVTEEIPGSLKQGKGAIEEITRSVKSVLKEAASRGYSLDNNSLLSKEILNSFKTTKIRWDKYLRKFLSLVISDENSYDTPNKKYLPYDLIMPGPGGMEEVLTDVFIFIDTLYFCPLSSLK